jgi:hypothetical protein
MKKKHILIGHNGFINFELIWKRWTTPFISVEWYNIMTDKKEKKMFMLRIGLLCFEFNYGIKFVLPSFLN